MKKTILLLLSFLVSLQLFATIRIVGTTAAKSGCTGSITVEATGTAGPFTVVLTLPNGSQQSSPAFTGTYTFSNLCSGAYSLAVNNRAVCATVLTAQVACSFDVTASQAHQCGATNGSVLASPTGGTAPYAYLWRRPNGNTSTNNPFTISTEGLYQVTVTDATGCQAATQIQFKKNTLAMLPDFNSAASITPACSSGLKGGSICLTVDTTKFMLQWPSLNKTGLCVSNLAAGNHCVKLTDKVCGTVYYRCFNVGQAAPPAMVLKDNLNAICGNNTQKDVGVEISGGKAPYTYAWSTGSSSSAIVASSGNVTVSVTDFCGTVTSKVIAVPTGFLALAIPTVEKLVSCSSDRLTATATVTGGRKPYQYEWYDFAGNTMTKNTSAPNGPIWREASILGHVYTSGNNFKVKVTDACNQSVENAFRVTPSGNSTDFSITSINILRGWCNDSPPSVSIELSNTTPKTYKWSNGGPNNLGQFTTPGLYTVSITGTSSGACGVVADVLIEDLKPALKYVSTSSAAGAAQGAITLSLVNIPASASFSWANGRTTQTITGLNPGSYCVTVSFVDEFGSNCSKNACITVPTTPTGSNLQGDLPADLSAHQAGNATKISVLQEEKIGFVSRVFPNPFQNQVSLEIEAIIEQRYQIVLYNALGQVLKRQNLEGVVGLNRVELFPEGGKGLLYIEITDPAGNRVNHKVIRME